MTCLLLLNETDTSPPAHCSACVEAGVVGGGVVLDDGAAVQLAGRRLHPCEMTELRGQGRAVGRVDPFEVGVLNQRVQALDGEIEVALERPRRGLVERQLEIRPVAP